MLTTFQPIALALALALAAPDPLVGQGRRAAPKLAPFNGTLDEAYQRAFDRNVPALLIAIVETDGAEDKDIAELRQEVFASSALAQACDLAVLVLACNRVHKLSEVEAGDPPVKKQVCSVYRTEGCGWHQKQFDAMYREFQDAGGELRSPSVLVVGPDRKFARKWQTGDVPPMDDVLAALAEVRAKAGEGLTEAQLESVRALVRRGTEALEKRDFGTAYRAWSGVLAITQKTRYADQARTELTRALAGLTEQLGEARAELAQGRIVDGYKGLLALLEATAATPLEAEVKREIALAEAGKDTKGAIAAYKRELEAERIWREAEALRDEPKKAEAKLRQLIRKYADTPAGKRARDAHPDWTAEEDAKKKAGG